MSNSSTSKPPYGVLLVRAYVDLVDGDVPTALMLSQIVYWHLPSASGKRKLQVRHGGEYWLAKSAVHWREEIGVTPKQAYRSTKVLIGKGLIETCTKKFAGSPTVHVRLTPAGQEILNLHPGHSHPPSKPNPFPSKGKSITETTAQTTAETTTAVDPAGKPAGGVQGKVKQGETLQEGSKKNVATLVGLWKKHLAHDTDGFQKELTKKEVGQLRDFRNKVGVDAGAVLEFALLHWSKFGWEVKMAKGLSKYPTQPQVGFVLAHHDVLMQMVAKKTEFQAKVEAGKVAQPSPKYKTLVFGPQALNAGGLPKALPDDEPLPFWKKKKLEYQAEQAEAAAKAEANKAQLAESLAMLNGAK